MARWRTISKWTLTIAAALSLAAVALTLSASVRGGWVSKDGKNSWGVTLFGGCFMVYGARGHDVLQYPMGKGWEKGQRSPWFWCWYERGWGPGILWDPPSGPVSPWGYGTTLVYPVVLSVAPAGLLWYLDRRRRPRPGQCPCGYSRRGLGAEAPCPKCGLRPTARPSY